GTLADAGLATDAGGTALAVAEKDAGAPLAVAAKDAGPAVAAVIDAGAPVAVAVKDAGVAAPVAGGDALAKLIDDAKAALVAQKYRKALSLYRDALKLSPEDTSLRSGLGIALVMSDMNYKEAIPYLKDAVKEDPASSQAWLALGIAFQNL